MFLVSLGKNSIFCSPPGAINRKKDTLTAYWIEKAAFSLCDTDENGALTWNEVSMCEVSNSFNLN